MLARGELRAVGATTLDEYRKHIEKDAALERRFQPVLVGEPSVADTIAILRGLKERYEAHHGVRIRDAALTAAAVLSERYITDRFLPDKAIDLVDEAASRLRMEIDSSPVELDEAERRVTQLEIELTAMAKETPAVREPVERELAEAKTRRDELAARWAGEKDVLDRVKEITRQIDELRMEAERAERHGDLQRVAEIRYGLLPALEHELAERGEAVSATEPMVKEEVDEDDIAAVVATWTKIPVDRLLEGEVQKLVHMESAVASARRRPGGSDRRRLERAPPRALRTAGSEPPDRLVRLPRPDGRREDRAREGARGVHVRRRAGDRPARHDGVHGKAHRVAPARCPSRLRRLRRGRSADRGGPAPALLRHPARRDREGTRGRLQRAPAAARRRAPDRRAGTNGRLPQHGRDHDLEHPLSGSAARALQAGVRQPRRRDRRVRAPRPRADRRHRGVAARAPACAGSPSDGSRSSCRTRRSS